MLRLTGMIPTFGETMGVQVQLQSVRWKRKPLWLPTAKSKVFRVPERRITPPEEALEIQRLHNNYRTQFRAVRKHMIAVCEENKVEIDQAVSEESEILDFEHCSAINEAWNKQIAALREVRLAQERKEREDEILQKIQEKQERDAMIMREVEERVRRMKADVATFIDASMIDKAIEEALATPTDHGTTITADGSVHQHGEASEDTPEVKKQQQASL